MQCEEALDLMLLRDSGEADAEQLRDLDAHLAACSACREEAEDLDEALNAYRASRPHPMVPSAVREHITAVAAPTPTAKPSRILHMSRLAATAIATAAAVLAFLLLSGMLTPEPAGEESNPWFEINIEAASLDDAGITHASASLEMLDAASAELDSLDDLLAQVMPAQVADDDFDAMHISTDALTETAEAFSDQIDEALWSGWEL